MAYGTVKVDNITFDNGGSDQNVTVSGLYNSLTSGVSVTGTISGSVVIGSTSVSGTTVLGTTVTGTTVQGVSGTFTSLTGTTTSGTTANFVSGVFTTQISGATVTGTTANFTSGNFTNISGGTHTITSGVFAAGSATNPSISFTSDPNSGLFSPGADQVAISTNGTGRLFVDASGNVGIGSTPTASKLYLNGSLETTAAQLYLSSNQTYIDSYNYNLNLSSVLSGGIGGNIIFNTGSGTVSERMRLDSSGGLQFKGAGTAGVTQAVSFNGSAPVNSLVIDSSGRVGLGTSSPGTLLEVVSSTDDDHLTLYKTGVVGGAGPGIKFSGQNNSGTRVHIAGIRNELTSGTVGAEGGALVFTTKDNGDASPQERLYISSAGNVGIGTTSPQASLGFGTSVDTTPSDVSKIQLYNSGGIIYGFGVSANQLNYRAGTVGDSHVWHVGLSEKARIDGSGRLLVGTSSEWDANADSILQLVATGASNPKILTFGRNSNSADAVLGNIEFYSASNVAARISAANDLAHGAGDGPGRLVFSTTADGASSPTERMRITSDGVIFQYSHQYNFDSSQSTIEFVNRNSGGAKTFQWYVGASGGTPVATLTTAGVWTNASDVKNKENIEDIAYGIETIKSLRPRQFDVKSDGSHNIGFIAQEVKPFVPEVVHETTIGDTGESHLGLDYGSLTAVLTKALQEALTKIETLEVKVAALEGL